MSDLDQYSYFVYMRRRSTNSNLRKFLVELCLNHGNSDLIYLHVAKHEYSSQIWDGTKCKRIRNMGGHQTRTGILAWSSCILSSGSRDKNILQHDIRVSNDFISKFTGHRSEVGHQLVQITFNYADMYLIDLSTLVSFTQKTSLDQVCGLKWSHDDRELASGGNDNQVKLYFISLFLY